MRLLYYSGSDKGNKKKFKYNTTLRGVRATIVAVESSK